MVTFLEVVAIEIWPFQTLGFWGRRRFGQKRVETEVASIDKLDLAAMNVTAVVPGGYGAISVNPWCLFGLRWRKYLEFLVYLTVQHRKALERLPG